jgi:phosphate transport system permease protein
VRSVWLGLAAAVGTFFLVALFLSVLNSAYGYVALQNEVNLEEIAPGAESLDELSTTELESILRERLSSGLIRRLDTEAPLSERSQEELAELVAERVIDPQVVESWSLAESLFRRGTVERYVAQHPDVDITFRTWLNAEFLVSQQSNDPLDAGIVSALIGTLLVVTIALLVAMPIGIATGIFLSEYARPSALRTIVQINIQNLAAIPPVIYGLLGLALFVRFGSPVTSGSIFGAQTGTDGRTVLSAGLTLGVLVLPVVIINAQEAFASVPERFRDAARAVGASKTQLVFGRLLPHVSDRIVTVAILALSRVIGETTPLIIVGAATVIAVNPSSLFAQFTALPSQIYYWSFSPQSEFQRLAAAAILVLLVLSLGLNIFLVLLRRRIQQGKG